MGYFTDAQRRNALAAEEELFASIEAMTACLTGRLATGTAGRR